jgi:adenosine deaminase CECR1
MTLHGWKQLALWSIEHSCMDAEEQARVLTRWKQLWHEFCLWIIQEYSYILDDSKLHEDH